MFPAGVIAGDRMYLSGVFGRDQNSGSIPEDPAAQVGLALDSLQATLKAAGLDFGNMVFVNPYLTLEDAVERDESGVRLALRIRQYAGACHDSVAGLPGGANVEFTGVAVMDLAKRRAVRPKNMEPSADCQPLRARRGHVVLFRQIGLYSRREWRDLREHGGDAAAADDAQSVGRIWRRLV